MKFIASIALVHPSRLRTVNLESLFRKWFSSEPKVTTKRSRQGNIYFRIDDPISGFSGTFSSEEEVRLWLEQRYYQNREG